jgi:8-oxo-dGTP diphosphatase
MSIHPQKILPGRYQVIPRSIILLIDGGKVLLQQASEQKKIYPGYFNGIGGHIERGEDVLAGAIRELKEESGLTCQDLYLAGTIMIDVNEHTGILLFVFSGTRFTGQLVSSDEGTLHWVDIEQLEDLPVVEDIPELVAKIREFNMTGKPFFGKYLYDDQNQRVTSWK